MRKDTEKKKLFAKLWEMKNYKLKGILGKL